MPQFAAFEDGVKRVLGVADGPHRTGGWVHVKRCDPGCHPRDHALPGGQRRGCQRQVPGGYLLNNASGLGVGVAGAPL